MLPEGRGLMSAKEKEGVRRKLEGLKVCIHGVFRSEENVRI